MCSLPPSILGPAAVFHKTKEKNASQSMIYRCNSLLLVTKARLKHIKLPKKSNHRSLESRKVLMMNYQAINDINKKRQKPPKSLWGLWKDRQHNFKSKKKLRSKRLDNSHHSLFNRLSSWLHSTRQLLPRHLNHKRVPLLYLTRRRARLHKAAIQASSPK